MNAILKVCDLKLNVVSDGGVAQILDFVDQTIYPKEVLGLVGESGCGKSTLIRTILGLPPKGASVVSGSVQFKGNDMLNPAVAAVQRGRGIGFIPQDPFLSFNPSFTVGRQMMEILRWSGMPDDPPRKMFGSLSAATKAKHQKKLVEVLRLVQVPDPERALHKYPHEFSGGQRQRVLIAGALAAQPSLILADEPTTALDVTTQMQILALLRRIVEEHEVAMLFVTHDFGVLAQICDRVTVMYAGQTIETGTASQIMNAPLHPYTAMLLGCHPERTTEIIGIPGTVSSPLRPPPGCRFAPRCPAVIDACTAARPQLKTQQASQSVACYRAGVLS